MGRTVRRIMVLALSFILVLGGMAMAQEKAKMAIIVVDLQGDFTKFKNGSLAVEGTDEAYIKAVQESTKKLKEAGFSIYATQDWHPADHASFFTNHKGKKAFDVVKLHGKDQVLWPPHCVQNTPGAEILLDKKLFKAIVKKGMDPQYDSYSGFQDDGGKKTEMDKLLKKEKIKEVVVYGIATDYCVKATALDAAAAGYKVIMIKNLSRGVAPDTTQKAIDEMKAKRVVILDDLDLEGIKAK
ncbi:MAG TPA: bifunctional nicotinamidase/pyrazinamidase [Thermodesulfobacteriota bacterium]|nr:bifunctional nicotinamidase/pyrazinamidase [Thermodesulfobacteriota bacterium]